MKANGPSRASAREDAAPTRASLLARLKDLDDEPSWREFFDTYHPLIYRHLIHRGLTPQDAEDVVAEVVAGVARRMPGFVYEPERGRFKTWLFRIVKRRFADHFRRRSRMLPLAQVDVEGEAESNRDEIADPATLEPDEKWEQAWEENRVHIALDRVSRRANPRLMQMYLYSEVEGHSVAKTARDFQTTANDVSVARHRIRQMLREEGERLLREEKRLEAFGF